MVLKHQLTISLIIYNIFATYCFAAWNNPYPEEQSRQNILYTSFSERPKHLDPIRSYSATEYQFLAQIYEPLLQYHFLHRPYQLVPLTLEQMPDVVFLNKLGQTVSARNEAVFTEYRFKIKPNIYYQPHPALAKDEQGVYRYHKLENSPDYKTLSDFEYSGSRELKASDYVYQIKRLVHPKLYSPIGGLMQEYIVGLPELAAQFKEALDQQQGQYLDLREYELTGVQVINDYQFSIRINGVYPQFIYWLAMPFFAPMPWEAEKFYVQPILKKSNISLDWYPIGTGPYMLSENNPNLRIVLDKNPNFHGESYPQTGEPEDEQIGLLRDAGKPLPFIEKVVFNLEKESIPYWNKFLQGYYDNSGISSDSFDQAVNIGASGNIGLTDEMKEKGIRLSTAVETSIFYLGFNMLDKVVGGSSERARLLRQAISVAIDYEEYISIFNNGRGVAAQGPVPPGIFGNIEGQQGLNPYVYDWMHGKPKRKPITYAKKLLEKAGYENGVDIKTGQPLTLYYESIDSGPDGKARLNWLRKQFAKLNLQLVVRSTDYNRFQEKMRSGAAQIFMWGWNADYPDPENFFFLLYGPNSKVNHQGENAANFNNAEFNTLFDRMKNMPNSSERQIIINQMHEIVRHHAPWAWGFYPKKFSLYHGWFHNVKPNLMANNTLKYKRIEPEIRQQKRELWNQPVIWPVFVIVLLLLLLTVPAILAYRRHERSRAL